MQLRHILAIILVIVLAFMLLSKSEGAEVQLPEFPRYMPGDLKVQTVDEFAAIPYDFAKNFPDELYYWWARAHNEREYDLATQGRRVINQVGVSEQDAEVSSASTFRGNAWGWNSNGASAVSNRSSARNTERIFEFREGGGPAVIYNPYARSQHGSQNQKE